MSACESVCGVRGFFMCILTVCLLHYLFTLGLSQQHEKWTAILEQMVFSSCVGSLEISHLIQAVIEQDNLGLLALGTFSDQHVARVWVTVNEAMDEDHFTVDLTQVLRNLNRTEKCTVKFK